MNLFLTKDYLVVQKIYRMVKALNNYLSKDVDIINQRLIQDCDPCRMLKMGCSKHDDGQFMMVMPEIFRKFL